MSGLSDPVFADDSDDPEHPPEETRRDVRVVLRADLEGWWSLRGRQFRRDLEARFAKWLLGIGTLVVGTIIIAVWNLAIWKKDMESDARIHAARVQALDGYPNAIREMGRQVDSLRIEMRYLPSTIVAELERRDAWKRR